MEVIRNKEKRKSVRQKFKLKIHIFCFLLLPLAFLCGCQPQRLYKDNRVMMGTFIEVTSPSKEAPAIVFDELARIEGLLSKYDPASEVAKLNVTGALKASPETFFVIERSVDFWRLTDGAFDITVAPLMDLWGFTTKQYRLPQPQEIAQALGLVGSDKIILNKFDNVIEFKLPGMKIDLGGIAKGYALDRACVVLRRKGIRSCLINAGGQVYCLGDKFGAPWEVAVQNPRGRSFIGSLSLRDASVATSGDYEQFFIADHRRYSHILDPRTGYPVENGVASVTVIASEGLTADALATSLLVIGRERAQGLIEKFPGVQVKNYEYANQADPR